LHRTEWSWTILRENPRKHLLDYANHGIDKQSKDCEGKQNSEKFFHNELGVNFLFDKMGSIEKSILIIILDYQISLYSKLCFFNLSGSVSFFSLGT
jgi:hypothetical protein